jgi:ornithine cyclodeaminase
VLGGRHPGRPDARAITVFTAVGLPFQDLAVAWTVYERAQARALGEVFDFSR